jgi:hypothetical protein
MVALHAGQIAPDFRSAALLALLFLIIVATIDLPNLSAWWCGDRFLRQPALSVSAARSGRSAGKADAGLGARRCCFRG